MSNNETTNDTGTTETTKSNHQNIPYIEQSAVVPTPAPTSPAILEDDTSRDAVLFDDMEDDGEPISLEKPTSDDDDDEAPEIKKPDVRASNYTLTNLQVSKDPRYDCTIPSKLSDISDTMVALPNHTADEINQYELLKEFLDRVGDVKGKERKPTRAWLEQFEVAMEHLVLGGMFSSALGDKDSKWHQYLEHEGKRIRAHKPKYLIPEEGQVTGPTAQAVLDNRLGLGGHITIVLPHSGFWITIKPVTPLEFLTLDERLSAVKNEFGRSSIGLVFNNNRVYVVKHMVEFLLDRVYDCSIEGWEDLDLTDYMKVTDLLILAAGGGYTLYPHGFDYAAPCTANNDCDHTQKAVLKIPNCIWYDHPAFTKSQTALLGNRSKKHPVEDILKYQSEFEDKTNSYISPDGITVYFKIPTVKEHIESGEAWFAEIESMVDAAIVGKEDEQSKQQRMQRRINQTVLRQQAHFFKRVTFDDGIYLEGIEDMYNALNSLSNRPEVTEGIMEHIGKYIDENVHALVAIPRYACDVCHQQQEQQVEKHPFLIPLDTINLFFTLGNQRLHIGSPNMQKQNS